MKFCKDCKHFKIIDDLSMSKCIAPSRPYDPVWGGQIEMTARHSRNLAITGCGEDAKWFEPKPSPLEWYRKLFSVTVKYDAQSIAEAERISKEKFYPKKSSILLIFVLIRVVSVTEQERQPFLSPLHACVLLFRVEVVLLGAFFDFGFWRVEFFQFVRWCTCWRAYRDRHPDRR